MSTVSISMSWRQDGADPFFILLHGFPSFWWTWRKQITPLAEAGCHVVVPDMRDYNGSATPSQVEANTIDTLATDVVTLASAFGAAFTCRPGLGCDHGLG